MMTTDTPAPLNTCIFEGFTQDDIGIRMTAARAERFTGRRLTVRHAPSACRCQYEQQASDSRFLEIHLGGQDTRD